MSDDRDLQLRLAALDRCAQLRAVWGEAVPAEELTRGFTFDGERVLLVSWGRGIFKPAQLGDGPLTLVSSLASTYADEHLEGNQVLYDFAPPAFDWANRGLQELGILQRPVILLKQVKEKPGSEYMIFSPVYVVSTDVAARKFRLDLAAGAVPDIDEPTITGVIEKRYSTAVAKVRMHQAHFRRDVLGAYRDRCCVCQLQERPLLDAAHITPDAEVDSAPVVQNGLALCPSHHRAFDKHLFEIGADYRVYVDPRRLQHSDSEPTKELLWRFHERSIWLPKNAYRPDPERLQRRLESAVA